MEKKYNGWNNYETWCVNLWLTNDEGTSDTLDALTAEAAESDSPVSALEDSIKGMVEECAPELGASMFSDLLNSALSEVDYREIARSHLGDWWSDADREARIMACDSVGLSVFAARRKSPDEWLECHTTQYSKFGGR